MSEGPADIIPIGRVKKDDGIERIRVQCDKHPDAIGPGPKKAANALVALICGDWERMREIAAIYSDPAMNGGLSAMAADVDAGYLDCVARCSKYTEALLALGFRVGPPRHWTCDVKNGDESCIELVGHNRRHTWDRSGRS